MKKLILSFVLLLAGLSVSAQDGGTSEWLTEFSEVSLSGPFAVTFVQVPETEAPRIVYDTKGSYTSKFKAEVRNGVLTVTEKTEARRTTTTEVKVCFHAIRRIRVSGATVSFPGPFKAAMLDVGVNGGATFDGMFDVTDLAVELSGRSRALLSGEVRYLTLTAATGKVDAARLRAMSVRAEASNSAEVSVCATERLEAKTSTDARISYTGDPAVLRGGAGFTGGEVVELD